MNDQLQAQITQILAQISTGVSKAADYSIKELPDIAQQYVTYGMWSAGFYTVTSFLIFVCCAVVFTKCANKIRKPGYDVDDDPFHFIAFLVSISAGLVSFMAMLHNAHSFLLVMTAPKVWFILQLKELLS